MSPDKVDFLRRLLAERPADRRSAIAHRVAAEDSIGSVRGRMVLYTPGHFELAGQVLANRGFHLVAPGAGGARADAPDASSEKVGSAPVTQDLVAVVPFGLAPQLGHAPPGSFLAMHWAAALALPYEVLVVCENLEPMRRLASYPWLRCQIAGRPALVLYRGTVETFRVATAHQLVQRDTRPVLALFDFDPKGLSMANALPRMAGLCLPPRDELEALVRRYKRFHLYADQVQFCRGSLDASLIPDIAQAWALMQSMECGLNQEAFPAEEGVDVGVLLTPEEDARSFNSR